MPAFQKTRTAQDTVNSVLGSLGLPQATSVFDSIDGNVIQLRTLLTECGEELLTEHKWQFFEREMNFFTVPDTVRYALPADFDSFVSDAQWNYTSRLPLLGSVNEQDWQQLKARNLGSMTITLMFRVSEGWLELYAAPSASQQLVLPYQGRGWVLGSDGLYSDNVSTNADMVLYDSRVMRTKLMLKWLTRKGFDTTAANREFTDALAAAKSIDVPASSLSMVPGGMVPLLSVLNSPETGYGGAT